MTEGWTSSFSVKSLLFKVPDLQVELSGSVKVLLLVDFKFDFSEKLGDMYQ